MPVDFPPREFPFVIRDSAAARAKEGVGVIKTRLPLELTSESKAIGVAPHRQITGEYGGPPGNLWVGSLSIGLHFPKLLASVRRDKDVWIMASGLTDTLLEDHLLRS